MTPICRHPQFDQEHMSACQRDVTAQAGELLPLLHAGTLKLADVRGATNGFHECHTVALLLELVGMFDHAQWTVTDVRTWLAHIALADVVPCPDS